MSTALTIPSWIYIPAALFAALGLWAYILKPLGRAALRARKRQVITSMNPKLQLEMPPFQLTRRELLADRLANDPKVEEIALATAEKTGTPIAEVRKQVAAYAHDIVPAFNPYFYFRFGYMAARGFVRALYRVRLGYQDEDALAKVSSEDSVVFFINHRSNVDYVLVTYLAAGNTTLSFGVGEWARHWPFQQLMRSAGAYFVHRDATDPLYRRVLERYVQMATEARVPHAIFPEGGLSRDGAVHKPKLGLLDYITKTFDKRGPHDIVFMPIGVNYDRVPEEWNMVTDRDLAMKERGDGFVLRVTLAFLMETMWLKLRGRKEPFGYAVANFATPLSLRAWLDRNEIDLRGLDKAERFKWVERLGAELMGSVAQVIPVLSSSLVATVLVEAGGRAVAEEDIVARALAHAERLEAAGARVYSPRAGRERAVTDALRLMRIRKLVTRDGDLFKPVPDKLPLLQVYATSIAHLDPDRRQAAAQ